MVRKCESMDRAPLDPHAETAIRDIDAAVDADRETVCLKRLWDSPHYYGSDHVEAKWRVSRRGAPYVRRWRDGRIVPLIFCLLLVMVLVVMVYYAPGDTFIDRYIYTFEVGTSRGAKAGFVAMNLSLLVVIGFWPTAGVAVLSAASPVIIELRRLLPRRRRVCHKPEIMFAKRLNLEAKKPENRVFYLLCFGDSGTPLMILARGNDPERIVAAARNLPEQIRETCAFTVLRNPVRYHGL